MKIWKVSHGPGVISQEEHQALLQQQRVQVNKYSKAKGWSSVSQGDAFADPGRVGDVFFLCRGNGGIELLGVFLDEMSEDDDGWIARCYDVLATNANRNGGGLDLRKWWSPRDRSTFIEVKANEFQEFETAILDPFFGLTIADLMLKLQEHQSQLICAELCQMLKDHSQIILTGAPGTGKTHLALAIAARMIGIPEQALDVLEEFHPQFDFVQFHQSYDYSDFVEGLKPIRTEGGIVFDLRAGRFKEFCDTARQVWRKDEGKAAQEHRKFVFVIDEINRADLSRVFGEVFFAIEQGYRGKAVRTQYASLAPDGGRFSVPPNVFIVGTMNDIDRSVESMDFALRRRFAWKEIHADEACFDRVMAGIFEESESDVADEARRRYGALNTEIARTDGLGIAYQIGPAYYRQLAKYKQDPVTMWNRLWDNHLDLLLREYLRGMPIIERKIAVLRSTFDLIAQ